MSEDLPVSRLQLVREDFPFTIKARNARTGEVVWVKVIDKPTVLSVPPLAQMIGSPVEIVIEWPDGRIEEVPAPNGAG